MKIKTALRNIIATLFLYMSLFLADFCHAEILHPLSIKDLRGESTTQPLKVLASQDQTHFDDDWDKYLEFTTRARGYVGIFTFPAPADLNNLDKMVLHTNYRGPEKSYQKWRFKIFDFQEKKWIYISDNSQASSWKWQTIIRSVGKNPKRFINRDKIKVSYYTKSSFDNSQLDYLVIKTTSLKRSFKQPVNRQTKDSTNLKNTNWWQPKPGSSWQINYSDNKNDSVNVDIHNIDLFDTDKAQISTLHAQGKRVICYFSGGSFEKWRPDAKDFPASVIGKNLDGWPGEKWLDIRKLDVLLPVMEKRMKMAANKGCDAVDPDNMDSHIQKTGFSISPEDQLVYNIEIAKKAHDLGLAVGLKNNLEQIKALVDHFDFAVNEECFSYKECNLLKPFINKGKPVFGIEYKLNTKQFCSTANQMGFDFIKKRLSLDAFRISCR